MNGLDLILPAAIGISAVIALRIAEKRKKTAVFLLQLREDTDQQIAESIMKEKLPPSLRVLLPYAKRYSVGDDLLRSQLGDRLSRKEKNELITAVSPLLPEINSFLDSFGEYPLNNEAIVMGSLAEFVCELGLQQSN